MIYDIQKSLSRGKYTQIEEKNIKKMNINM